jgi:hypothetical protein
VAARAGGHPFPTVLGDELVHSGAFLDAGERRGGRKYHKGRVALSTTGLQVDSARTGRGKDAARIAEAWEEVVVKVKASPTSGRFIRAREAVVSEPSDTGLQASSHSEGGNAEPRSEGSTASLYVVVGTRRGLDGHLTWWAGTSGDVTLCDISGLGRRITPGLLM